MVPQMLMMRFLREASEDLLNHQVEAIELELDCVLVVFSSLKHLIQTHLEVPIEFDYPPILSVPSSSVSNIWDLVDSGINYFCIRSRLSFLIDCVFCFIQSSLELLRGI
jgi:hypothetical protein